jgi:hypothetical protein
MNVERTELNQWANKRVGWWNHAINKTDKIIIDRLLPELPFESELTETLLRKIRDVVTENCVFKLGTPYPQYFVEMGIGNCVSYSNITTRIIETICGTNCVIPFNLEAMHIVQLAHTPDDTIWYYDTRGETREDFLFHLTPKMLKGGEDSFHQLQQDFSSQTANTINLELNIGELPVDTPFINERHTGRMYGIKDRRQFFLVEYIRKDASILRGNGHLDKANVLVKQVINKSSQAEPY